MNVAEVKAYQEKIHAQLQEAVGCSTGHLLAVRLSSQYQPQSCRSRNRLSVDDSKTLDECIGDLAPIEDQLNLRRGRTFRNPSFGASQTFFGITSGLPPSR